MQETPECNLSEAIQLIRNIFVSDFLWSRRLYIKLHGGKRQVLVSDIGLEKSVAGYRGVHFPAGFINKLKSFLWSPSTKFGCVGIPIFLAHLCSAYICVTAVQLVPSFLS